MNFWGSLLGRPTRRKLTPTEKKRLYEGQQGRCNGCGKKFSIHNMTDDHKRALAKGGSNTLRNAQLLCGHCNSTKSTGTMAQLRKRLKAKGVTPKAAPAKRPAAKRSTAKKTPARRRKRDPFFDW